MTVNKNTSYSTNQHSHNNVKLNNSAKSFHHKSVLFAALSIFIILITSLTLTDIPYADAFVGGDQLFTINNLAILPTIKITKDTINGDGSFNFTIFNATNPANSTALNIPDTFLDSMTSSLTVQAGSYSVIETVPLNWNLISSDCLVNGIPQGSTLNFALINDDVIECIFKNTFVPPAGKASIKITKDTTNGEGDSMIEAINYTHNGKNTGNEPTKILVVVMGEK